MSATYASKLAGEVVASGYSGLVLQRIAAQVSSVLAAPDTCIFVRDLVNPDESIVAAAHGRDADEVVGRRLENGVSAVPGTGAVTAATLASAGRVNGTLALRAREPDRQLSAHELRVLAALADTADAAIVHANAGRALQPAVRERMRRLAGELDQHDGYTAEHSAAIAALSCAIGERFGLDTADLAELEIAALLHDVGKLRVPLAVLHKDGPLDEAERSSLNLHPDVGADMVARIPGLEATATVVRYHHERWDGRGYPHRLSGHRIPFTSRIIAVCDAFHAMTSERPYRRAMRVDDAVAILEKNAGLQFDPRVVDEFRRAIDDSAFDPSAGGTNGR